MNASTISGPHQQANSSGDTRAFHPYIVEEKAKMQLEGDRTAWKSSIITRTKYGVKVKIITK